MSDFKREERYIVIKIKDLKDSQEQGMRNLLAMNDIPTRECVVVEPDWPIYEDVWDMVRRVAEDRPQKLDELTAMLEDAQASAITAETKLDEADKLAADAFTRVNEVIAERDALAAHVERGRSIMAGLCENDFTNRSADQKLFGWYTDAPATSLARLKTRWQVEVLEEFQDYCKIEQAMNWEFMPLNIMFFLAKRRREFPPITPETSIEGNQE